MLRAVGSRAVVGIYQAWFLASFAVARNVHEGRPCLFVMQPPPLLCYSSMLWSSHVRTGVSTCWTPLCTPTWSSSALYSLYSLYAFQHSGVIHPTAFYIPLLLFFAPMVTLSSACRPHTLWKYIRCKDRFLVVTMTYKSPLTNAWDSGGIEDMSNPPTVNWRKH